MLLVLSQQGPLKAGFKRKLSELIPQRSVLEEQREGDTIQNVGRRLETIQCCARPRANSVKQQVITSPLLREVLRKLVSKNSCGTYQSCILSNTLPVVIKNASHFDFSRPFQLFLILRFLQNRLSSYRRKAGPAKETGMGLVDTDHDPEESESDTRTPKKGRKRKETPDPGLTMGTDIRDYMQPDGTQVEVELDNVRVDQEKTKGQMRWKHAKLRQRCIESLERSSMGRQQYVSNRLFVLLVARALAHGPVFNSRMAIIGVYLDRTAFKQL